MSTGIELPANARRKGALLFLLGFFLTIGSPSVSFPYQIVFLLWVLGMALICVGVLFINPSPKRTVINIFLGLVVIAIANTIGVGLHSNGWLPTWR